MQALSDRWPSLPTDFWTNTSQLHRWTQLAGMMRRALSPLLTEWWQIPLHFTPQGLSTGPIAFAEGSYELIFNFRTHEPLGHPAGSCTRQILLEPRSVADFYHQYRALLRKAGIREKGKSRAGEGQASIADVFQILTLDLPFTISLLSHARS
ncbi:DUF5996 family protein [Hymenobacter volaticus]|uniref:DUF5996 family protein n=1 Tax=Hymenobacter volaticus TaxID=2932254 RepID=A0ABY4GEY5_9BACT|nr:DUF5996 family protein [Hymenobacter volaticus]UOQ69438.1 DUF5996 family protein [Hymenobacter volaticus]